jgi:type II secretory pathway pseudopilin PulG
MKKVLISLLVGLIIGAVGVYFLLEKGILQKVTGTVTPSEKNSFYEVTSKLDKGGGLYLYVSTEKLIKSVDEFANKLRKLIEQEVAKSEAKETAGLGVSIFDFVYGLIKNCGLMEISGIGVSSVALDSNLYQSKCVVHHYKGNGKGLIWQLMEEKPHELEGLKLLPADTVLAGFSDFKIKELWQWIKKEVEASNLPPVKKAILSVEPALEMQGIPLDKLLDSFAGRNGFILSLDSKKKSTIPMGKAMVEIPEPAIAIVFAVKDDFLFNLLQDKLPFAKKSEEKDIKKLEIPVPPMPILVQPVILQNEGLLILASNNQIVDAMFAAKESGNGLIATEEFKKLSANIPKKGNRFGFVGSRLFQVIMDIQKKTMEASKKEEPAAKEFMKLFQKEWTLYSVLQNTDEGVVLNFNHSLGLESFVLLPATAAAGVVAAIAVPNLLTATQKGKQKATMGDLKSISLAIDSYITDNLEAPQGNTLAEIRDKLQPFYIRELPLKDAWGNDFLYTHGTGDKKDEYAVASPGKDGVFNGWEQTGSYTVTQTEQFGYDIIISNGIFTFGPTVK